MLLRCREPRIDSYLRLPNISVVNNAELSLWTQLKVSSEDKELMILEAQLLFQLEHQHWVEL